MQSHKYGSHFWAWPWPLYRSAVTKALNPCWQHCSVAMKRWSHSTNPIPSMFVSRGCLPVCLSHSAHDRPSWLCSHPKDGQFKQRPLLGHHCRIHTLDGLRSEWQATILQIISLPYIDHRLPADTTYILLWIWNKEQQKPTAQCPAG